MKTLLLSILCIAAWNANAQTYGVGIGYDRDSATSNATGLESVEKNSIVVGARTSYGQFDAGVFEVKIRGERFFDAQQGGEIGYTTVPFPLGPVNISGRVGLGKVYNRGLGGGDKATYSTYTAQFALPITDRVALTTSFRFRPEDDLDRQKLYTVGATYAASKNLQLLVNYRHTRSTGPVLNGVSINARYFF